MKKDLLKGLTDEQIAMVKNCSSPDDLIQLAEDEGVELTDEQLRAISGGACSTDTDEDKTKKDDGHRKFES